MGYILHIKYIGDLEQHLLKQGKPSEINQKPVGTGPFIFRKYEKESAIMFDGNPEYWKPEDVRLFRLIFDIAPDAAPTLALLQKFERRAALFETSVEMIGAGVLSRRILPFTVGDVSTAAL